MAYYCKHCERDGLNPWVEEEKGQITTIKSPRINLGVFDEAT
jgi:hypothetical protein